MEPIVKIVMDQLAAQGLSLSFSVIAVIKLWYKIKECEEDRKHLWERLISVSENKELWERVLNVKKED